MTSPSERTCTTTILVKNLHCASCVSTIRDILRQYGNALTCIEGNTVTQEVRLSHTPDLNVRNVCAELVATAFELHSAVTMDEKGDQLQELDFTSGDVSWFDSLSESRNNVLDRSGGSSNCITFPAWRFSPTKRHIQNCDACRRELLEDADTIRKSEKTGLDLEAGQGESRERLNPAGGFSPLAESVSNTAMKLEPPQAEAKETVVEVSGDGRYEATLSIGGMTCSSCTGAVDRSVSGLSFVEFINVTLITNSATVVFTDRTNLQKIVDAVENIGYDCTVDHCEPLDKAGSALNTPDSASSSRLVSLKITGMFCHHCPSQIQSALSNQYPDSLEIVKPPSLDDPILTISYTPRPPDFTIRTIVNLIDSSGDAFSAAAFAPPSIEQRSQAMQRQEQRRLRLRLIFALVSAIPTFLIGVVWMSLVPADNRVRKYLEKPALAGSVTGFEWALFFLATPVMFLAADVFHTRAFKEIRALWRRGSQVPVLRRFYRFGSMNLLISAGTSVAYFSSIAVLALDATTTETAHMSNSTYFDSVVFLTFFILLGRWLEAYSRAKTGNAVALLTNLRPEKAILVDPNYKKAHPSSSSSIEVEETKKTAETVITGANLLELGDTVLVQHGASPPTDGIILRGSTTFNESSLTGESRAVIKEQGDNVFAGAINTGDAVVITVTELSGTSMLDQIVSVVREGQAKRAPVERIVDVVTGYFVPIITALAIITFVIWVSLGTSGALDPRYLRSQQGGWTFWSLEFAIAVFVVACPCGIGLAAPTALFVGSGLAAEKGILVRGGGEAFQEASNIDCIVFDKTGTLTEGGDLKVTDHTMFSKGVEAQIAWSIIRQLEETSSHPLAKAMEKLAEDHAGLDSFNVVSTTEHAGLGLAGVFETPESTYEAALGSETFLKSLGPNPPAFDYFSLTTLSRWQSESKSVALLALRRQTHTTAPISTDASTPEADEQWHLALIAAVTDPIRPFAVSALRTLEAQNIPAYMLTGDNAATASAVASTLSIPQDRVFAGVLPTEKAEKIRWLQKHFYEDCSTYLPSTSEKDPSPLPPAATGSKKIATKGKAVVAFVGDGINDAPALTAANVSISFSSATDIAVHSSSFVILSSPGSQNDSGSGPATDPLPSIPVLLGLSRRVFRRVKFNFFWAVIYNMILVPVAAGCLFRVRNEGWRLGPVWGSAAMAASSLAVVGSSLALRVEFKEGTKRVWRRFRGFFTY